MDLDTILKITTIAFMMLVPILLFVLSLRYAKHIEDKKNKSSALYGWNLKWADIFFESYKNYQNEILAFLDDCELLADEVQSGTQNKPNGTEIQLRMNSSLLTIRKFAKELSFHVSNVSSGSNGIKVSTDKIYALVSEVFNSKQYLSDEILKELSNLNTLVKASHKEAVSKVV